MITVYGASDDLIEVEGDIREEFYANDDEANYLVFSDGTILSVSYDSDGLWRINRRVVGGAAYDKTEATDPDGDYSDKVRLTEWEFDWVMFGKKLARRKEQEGEGEG